MTHLRILDGLVAAALGFDVTWRETSEAFEYPHAYMEQPERFFYEKWTGTNIPITISWAFVAELIQKRDVILTLECGGLYGSTVGAGYINRFVESSVPLAYTMEGTIWTILSALGAFDTVRGP